MNHKDIKGWLGRLFNKHFKKYADEPIVIVTPTLGSNSGFVNMLNDCIFSDTATIIQYNPKEEFLENFILFYADTIERAKKVIFVDDAVATTQTIIDINFYIHHVRKNGLGLDYCVCLVNRIGYHNYLQMMDKLKDERKNADDSFHLFSYLNINVTPLPQRNKYPYLALMEKFQDLSQKSVLDSMKMHFKDREKNFRPIDLSKEFKMLDHQDRTKALLQFLLLHEFSNLFVFAGDRYLHIETIRLAFEESTPDSWQHIRSFFATQGNLNAVDSFQKHYPQYKYEIKNGLYKVCTSEPYLHNKHIKEAVFKWVLHDLINMVESINLAGKVEETFFHCVDREGLPASFSPYQQFRFLLKRGAKLKMNYIYSIDTLNAVKHILAGIAVFRKISRFRLKPGKPIEIGQRPKLEPVPDDSREIFPIGFITYYVALLQELIIEHESKALRLVVNIKKIIDSNLEAGGNRKTLKNSYNDHFIYLLRMLVLENTFIFHTSSEKFLSKVKPDLLFSNPDRSAFLNKLDTAMSTYSFRYTKAMLSRFEFKGTDILIRSEKESLNSFRAMMILKGLLKADLKEHRHQPEIPIELKLTEILKLACEILGIKNGGAMLAVKYKNKGAPSLGDDIHVVANFTSAENSGFSGFEITKDSLLFKIFDGITEHSSKKSISTLELTMDNGYKYHFRSTDDIKYKDLPGLFEFDGELFKNLFYLRITEFIYESEADKFEVLPQAVICFFDQKLSEPEYKQAREILEGNNSLVMQTELYRPETAKAAVKIAGAYEAEHFTRLDPKKIRQLLLLRNDLSRFITHHFDNDSLRAYIEQLKNKTVYKSLSHGTNTYEKLIDYYVGLIEKEIVAGRVVQPSHTRYLRTAFSYLINKLHLLSAANKLFESKEPPKGYSFDELTIQNIIDEFKKEHDIIFMMKIRNFNSLDSPDRFQLDCSEIPVEILQEKVSLFQNLLPELVFEILYNIKKHCINMQHQKMQRKRPLRVRITAVYSDTIIFLRINNNYSMMKPDYMMNLNSKLIKSDSLDGLNLIYNIIYKTTGQRVFLDAMPGEFGVNIPLLRKK